VALTPEEEAALTAVIASLAGMIEDLHKRVEGMEKHLGIHVPEVTPEHPEHPEV